MRVRPWDHGRGVRWMWDGFAQAGHQVDLETAHQLADHATRHPLRHDVLLR